MTSATGVPAPVRRTCLRCASVPNVDDDDDDDATTCDWTLNINCQQPSCEPDCSKFQRLLPTSRISGHSKQHLRPARTVTALPRFGPRLQECRAASASASASRPDRFNAAVRFPKNVYKSDCHDNDNNCLLACSTTPDKRSLLFPAQCDTYFANAKHNDGN
jgi:hypothetical protein